MLQPGASLPSIHVTPLAGGHDVSTGELIASAPVLLVFFHTTCPVCQMSLPFVDRLAKGSGVRIVPVSQDDSDDTTDFAEAFQLTMPLWLDSRRTAATKALGIEYVPSFLVVEKDGRISKSVEGFSRRDFEDLGERVGIDVFSEAGKVPVFRPG